MRYKDNTILSKYYNYYFTKKSILVFTTILKY